MTKDGRPSVLNDIRLFCRDRWSYLEGQDEAVAYGRRLAWYLNGEGLSLGAFPALYVLFTSTLAHGAIQMTNDGGDWWQRYVLVGVKADFPDTPDTVDIVMDGIVDALVTIRPDQRGTIEHADEIVRANGERLRFLLRRNETKKHVLEISSNINAWPEASFLFVGQIDKATDMYSEADPIPLRFYDEALNLRRAIRLKDVAGLVNRPRPPAISNQIFMRR